MCVSIWIKFHFDDDNTNNYCVLFFLFSSTNRSLLKCLLCVFFLFSGKLQIFGNSDFTIYLVGFLSIYDSGLCVSII